MPTEYKSIKHGFRLVKTFERPSTELVYQLQQMPAAVVSDVQGRHFTMSSSVHAITFPDRRIAGPALTVKARPGDNLLAMKAIELAQKGDVIVISSGDDRNLSVWGGIMATMAVYRGIAGVVTDGIVRDVEQSRSAGLPIWATGLTPAGPTGLGPGQINLPISCGGVVINPGDVILADEDGVVVVPRADLEAVVGRAQQRVAVEADWLEHIAHGDFSQLMHTDEKLRGLGCEIIE
jgi:regulator of RNase E activity RraA